MRGRKCGVVCLAEAERRWNRVGVASLSGRRLSPGCWVERAATLHGRADGRLAAATSWTGDVTTSVKFDSAWLQAAACCAVCSAPRQLSVDLQPPATRVHNNNNSSSATKHTSISSCSYYHRGSSSSEHWRGQEFVLGCTAKARRAQIRGRKPRAWRDSWKRGSEPPPPTRRSGVAL